MSDRSFRGERPDASGPVLHGLLAGLGFETGEVTLVPDEVGAIVAALTRLADREGCDVIVTAGGTGLSPRDVTPEATCAVLERRLPAMEAALAAESLRHTPLAMLSRAVAGARGRTLIVNVPGSPKAVVQCLAVIGPVLAHAATLLRDEDPHAAPRPAAAR